MRNLKLKFIALFVAMPCFMMSIDQSVKKELEAQVLQLKQMLSSSNDAYILNAIPMSSQDLTFQWYLQFIIPFKIIQAEHCYNAEILLEESKKLADIISAMEDCKSVDSCDSQVSELIKRLIKSNEAYMRSIPMYQQDLTFQWYLQFIIPFKRLQLDHCYNAEVLLTESKRLSNVIAIMIKLQK